MTGRKKGLFFACVTVMLMLVIGMSVYAAPKKGWTKTSKGYTYYRDGKALKGLQTIGQKTYYFDSKGIQRTSWRKIGKNYYCFHAGTKTKGYMMVNSSRNGIKLGEDGIAILSSDRASAKAKTMSSVSKWLDSIIEKQKVVNKPQKTQLKAVFDYLRKTLPYRFVSHFRTKDSNWDLWSVEYAMKYKRADCHPFACSFAYLANALGYNDITVFSWYTKKYGGQGHSWVRIGKTRIYDVSLSRFNKKSYKLFGMKESTYKKKYPYYKIKHTMKLSDLNSTVKKTSKK